MGSVDASEVDLNVRSNRSTARFAAKLNSVLRRPAFTEVPNLKKIGAGDEIRTHDFNLGKVALYP